MVNSPRSWSFWLVLGMSAGFLRSQCTNSWLQGDGLPGIDGIGTAQATILWDPDGPGPLAPRIVYGGEFQTAGTVGNCGNIAMQDTVTGEWSKAGSGTNGVVAALTVAPNGDLIVGGDFTLAGGVPVSGVARWNGTTWSAVGTGTAGIVRALAFLASGDLVAGGAFTGAGGIPASAIARWDGSSWSPFGTGAFAYAPASPRVYALTVLPNGDLIVGGSFVAMDGVLATNLARWNGSTWSSIGTGTDNEVLALTSLSNGNLAVGGRFINAGTVPSGLVAIWNGTSWISTNTPGVTGSSEVRSICEMPNGDLIAGGTVNGFGGIQMKNIGRWNGTSWSALASGTDATVVTLQRLPNGNVVATGTFSLAGTVPAMNAATWNGTAWTAITPGCNGRIMDLARAPNGDLIACGFFSRIGHGIAYLARWNGSTWAAIGATAGPTDSVAVHPNGNILAGSGAGFRFWNGTSWTSIAVATGGVADIVVMPNGDFVAGGNFNLGSGMLRIARWNGTSWSPLGSGMNGIVHTLLLLPDGTLIAGGNFTTAGGIPAFNIAKWDGTTWSSPFGLGFNTAVYTLARLPNGDIVAGGAFTAAGLTPVSYIARWNGSTWSALGSGTNAPVVSVVVLPDGDLIAGGTFTAAGTVAAEHVARWDGATWSACDVGVQGGTTPPLVYAMAFDKNGDLAVGGQFQTAGPLVSAYFARLSTSCPAEAASSGNGCPSSGGANTLSATVLPWVDATFTATATGLPTNGLVLTLTSVTPMAQGTVPLSAIFATGQAGCDVLVAPDILGILATSTGTAVSSFFLPSTPPLVGVTFYHQMIPIELDMLGAWVAVTATNALQLTAGAF